MEEKRILLGDRIKELRKERRMTQEALANATGISQRTIEDYEQGKAKTPSAVTVLLLSSYFEVEPANLLYGGGQSANSMNNGGSSMNTIYEKAIVEELKQITDFNTIKEIHDTDLNCTVLGKLSLTEDLITLVKTDWENKKLLKTKEKDGSEKVHKFRRHYVKDTILLYCQSRMNYISKYHLRNGIDILNEMNGLV